MRIFFPTDMDLNCKPFNSSQMVMIEECPHTNSYYSAANFFFSSEGKKNV